MDQTLADPLPPRNGVGIVAVVGAAILRTAPDGSTECLVARRAPRGSSPGLWEFPGGKVEPGETPRAALARELREELAIETEIGAFLGRGTIEATSLGKPPRTIVLDIYEAEWTSGELTLSDHDAMRWIRAGDVHGLDWSAADIPVLDRLIDRLTDRLDDPDADPPDIHESA